MNRPELMGKLRDEQVKMVAVEHQREGIKKLFDAACMMQNGPLMEKYRRELHDLLDLHLDCADAVMQMTRKVFANPE